MKIIHLIKSGPEEKVKRIIEIHRRSHDVEVIELDSEINYEELIVKIERADKVISW